MAAPYQYRDLGEIMGSWPISVLQDPAPAQQTHPNSILTKATIINTRREPTDGYEIGGLSLTIYVDVGGVPTAHTVTFPAGTGLGSGGVEFFTLAQVVARFQASTPALPANTASGNDGFLKLQSQTVGETSHLRLESILGAEEIFYQLGLQPEITVLGGELKAAQHIDPSRQVANINQLAMQHGETFSSDVLNRMMMQLAFNAGAARGTSDKRRVAVRTSESFTASGAAGVQLNTSSATQGVFTGTESAPTVDQLLDCVVVLDEDGNEFTKEQIDVLSGPDIDYTFSLQANSNKQLVTSPLTTFTSGDVAANRYVVVTDFAVATSMNDVPMKIIEFIDANTVVVMAIDPTDGSVVQITESNRSGSRIELFIVRCVVDRITSDAGFTTRVEQQNIGIADGSGSVTRIETPNRIFVSSANFMTDAQPGDLVTWSSAAITTPFSNNGTYRVSRVIDDKRIELVNEDYSPCYLNPGLGGGLGSISMTSDGDFFRQPYVRFAEATAPNLAAGIGAIPETGEDFQIVYMVEKTIKDALSDNPGALNGSVRHDSAASSDTQKALLRLVGPSITRIEDILHGTYDLSLEKLDFRMDKEHYGPDGRHSTIRPDVIDMYPNVTGVTHTLRSASGDAASQDKFRFFNSAGERLLSIPARGTFDIITYVDVSDPWNLETGNSLRWRMEADPTEFGFEFASTGGSVHLLKLNIYDDFLGGSVANAWVVDSAGRVGINMGTSGANPGQPQTNTHIRARSVADLELLRLEGFNDAHPTVGMSFKPLRGQPYLAFIETDIDTNDWFFNFALTAQADIESIGAIGVGTFRWVGGGTTEFMRLNSLLGMQITGVDLHSYKATNLRRQTVLGADMLSVSNDRRTAKLQYTLPSTAGAQVSLDRATGTTLCPAYNRVVDVASQLYEEMWSAVRSLTTSQYELSGPATYAALRKYIDPDGGLVDMGYQIYDGSDTTPFAVGDWIDVLTYNFTPFVDDDLQSVTLQNGVIRLPSGANSPNNQPEWDELADYNTIYPKSVPRAWVKFSVITDGVGGATVTMLEGMGFTSIAYNGTSGHIDFNLQVTMANTEYAAVPILIEAAVPVASTVRYLTNVVDENDFELIQMNGTTDTDFTDLTELHIFFIQVFGTQ